MGLGSQCWILSVAHEEEPIRSHVIINQQLTTVNTILCLGTPGGPPDSADCRKAPVCIHKQYSGNYNLGTFDVSHTPKVHNLSASRGPGTLRYPNLYSQHRDPRQEVDTATILLMSHGSHSRVYHAHFSLLTQDPMFHYIVTSSCLLSPFCLEQFLALERVLLASYFVMCPQTVCACCFFARLLDSLSCWLLSLCDRYVSVSDLYLWPNVLFAAVLVLSVICCCVCTHPWPSHREENYSTIDVSFYSFLFLKPNSSITPICLPMLSL